MSGLDQGCVGGLHGRAAWGGYTGARRRLRSIMAEGMAARKGVRGECNDGSMAWWPTGGSLGTERTDVGIHRYGHAQLAWWGAIAGQRGPA